MDPKKCWEEICEMAKHVQLTSDMDVADELAEKVLNLKEWLDKGGFSPF